MISIYRQNFEIEIYRDTNYETMVDWYTLLQQGDQVIQRWDSKYENIKNCLMTDRLAPKQIPQFSMNSNVKLQTQMQVNLHWVNRNKGNFWKGSMVTRNLQEDFEEQIAQSRSLLKHEALYLTNAVFCNYLELDDFGRNRRLNQENDKYRLRNNTLLDIHLSIFELVQYFCKCEKQILEACGHSANSAQFLYEYTIRVSLFLVPTNFCNSKHSFSGKHL